MSILIRCLFPSQPQVLDSLPTLKLTAGLPELRGQEAILSTLPLFLRDEPDTAGTAHLYGGSQVRG